ncbi:dockerin type I repeat-containing protein [Acetivibrio clariflavus]|uniref:dockerin type I repeat-containing protein n=1 Tax=Acetivibrio clariflavus TaxID=288965 RepID=UPI00211DCE84|nr:dockerin type I repeat-containing protein [Acetivibrio clariflavus]
MNSQILPQIVEGDTNGDGEFNSIDYATLKQILLGINTENRYIYWEQASDLDKNGTVDSIDYALMKMRLLGIK